MEPQRHFRFAVTFSSGALKTQHPGRLAGSGDRVNNEQIARAAVQVAEPKNRAGPQRAVNLCAAHKASRTRIRRMTNALYEGTGSVGDVFVLEKDRASQHLIGRIEVADDSVGIAGEIRREHRNAAVEASRPRAQDGLAFSSHPIPNT